MSFEVINVSKYTSVTYTLAFMWTSAFSVLAESGVTKAY